MSVSSVDSGSRPYYVVFDDGFNTLHKYLNFVFPEEYICWMNHVGLIAIDSFRFVVRLDTHHVTYHFMDDTIGINEEYMWKYNELSPSSTYELKIFQGDDNELCFSGTHLELSDILINMLTYYTACRDFVRGRTVNNITDMSLVRRKNSIMEFMKDRHENDTFEKDNDTEEE